MKKEDIIFIFVVLLGCLIAEGFTYFMAVIDGPPLLPIWRYLLEGLSLLFIGIGVIGVRLKKVWGYSIFGIGVFVVMTSRSYEHILHLTK